jgi:DNA polymerase-3 subunit delta'
MGVSALRENISRKIFGNFRGVKFPQAILLAGPSGSGKESIGKYLAGSILCEGDSPPCESCPSCTMYRRDSHPSFIDISPEGGKVIKAERIRNLKKELRLKEFYGNRRTILIQRTETLTKSGANSLLKILEEPPKNSHFILTASSPGKIPPTVRSRCIHVNVPPFNQDELQHIGAEEFGKTSEIEVARAAKLSCGNLDLFRHLLSGKGIRIPSLLGAILDKDGKRLTGILSTFRDNEDFRLGMIVLKRILLDLILLSKGENKCIIIDEIREGKVDPISLFPRKLEESFHILSSLESLPVQVNRPLVCQSVLLSLFNQEV